MSYEIHFFDVVYMRLHLFIEMKPFDLELAPNDLSYWRWGVDSAWEQGKPKPEKC
jgi:hypothetical protein